MKSKAISILLIIISTLIIYLHSVSNDFINWDDDKLVYQNEDITGLDATKIKKIFTSYYVQMYQPLTTISYALEYHFFGLNNRVFHFTNILLHIINSLLVFWFVLIIHKKNLTALLTALLFAVHPMHVESVAWIAERKDLLYSVFFLMALLFYLFYIDNSKNLKYLLLSLLFFLFSLLSKSAAVTLPLVLILLDWYKGTKPQINNQLNKIPYFVLSVVFGLITLKSQLGFSLPEELYDQQSVTDQVFIAPYSFLFYIFKFFIPVKLSALHPFPIKNNHLLPFEYYLSFILLISAIYLAFRFRKKLISTPLSKALLFGFIFFTCTISIVLILPVGAAVVAERYTYIPYIGLMFGCSLYAETLYSRLVTYKRIILITILCVLLILLSIISHQRLYVWKDKITFWTDIIHKYPLNVPLAYHNRGLTYYRNQQYVQAINDFNVVVQQKPKYPYTYSYRGLSKSAINDQIGAINDFSMAIMLKNNACEFYNNRGIEYKKLGNMNAALSDFNSSIKANPVFPDPYSNIGLVFLETEKPADAISFFDQAIKLQPQSYETYYNRGLAYYSLQNFDAAINDFNRVLDLNNASAVAYCERGICKARKGNFSEALTDLDHAIRLDHLFTRAYLNRGMVKISTNDISGACNDFKAANNPFDPRAKFYLEKYCN